MTTLSIHGSTSLRCRAQDHFGPSLACSDCTKFMAMVSRFFNEANYKDPVVYIPEGPLYLYFKFWAQLNKIKLTEDIKSVTHSLCIWDGDALELLTPLGKDVTLCNAGLKKVKFKKASKSIKPSNLPSRKNKIGKL